MHRDELERQIREIVSGCPGTADGDCEHCHCTGNSAVERVMDLIDQYCADRITRQELWTADQVARFLGLRNNHHARVTMSRARIAGIAGKHPTTGRRTALYPARKVRALKARRRKKST